MIRAAIIIGAYLATAAIYNLFIRFLMYKWKAFGNHMLDRTGDPTVLYAFIGGVGTLLWPFALVCWVVSSPYLVGRGLSVLLGFKPALPKQEETRDRYR